MSPLKRVLKVAAIRMLFGVIGVVLAVAAAVFSVLWRRAAPPASSPLERARSAPAVALATLPPEEARPPVVYASRGRRDPFLQSRLQSSQKEPEVNLKVTGIIWGPRAYYALVEPEPSDGKGYIIRENDVVDSARVLKITKQAVIFEVKATSAEGRPFTRHVRKSIGP